MIIGITGSFGTGKSTVARMFAEKGAKLLNADKLSHNTLKKGSNTYKKIVSYFGSGVLNNDKSINKKKLAKTVFKNSNKLKKLTSIIHPFVIRKIKDSIKKARTKDIVIDAPLLIEAHLTDIVDMLIVVKLKQKKQILRCMKKKRMEKKGVMARIKNQMPLKKKIRMADYVIDNNGTIEGTKKQVDKIWRKIKWI